MRALISMPEQFLNEVDTCAQIEGRSRSELVREALRLYMRNTNRYNQQKAIKNAEVLEELIG